jgi:hypothetical protein
MAPPGAGWISAIGVGRSGLGPVVLHCGSLTTMATSRSCPWMAPRGPLANTPSGSKSLAQSSPAQVPSALA